MADNNPEKPIPAGVDPAHHDGHGHHPLSRGVFVVGSQFMRRTAAMGTTVTDQLITSEFTQAVEQRPREVGHLLRRRLHGVGHLLPGSTPPQEAAGAIQPGAH